MYNEIRLEGFLVFLMKLPSLKKETEKKKITFAQKPNYVYIPLINQEDENITRLVKKGDYVYKGQAVGRRKGHLRIPIPSSVSGTVVGFEEHTYLSGKKVKCAVIENDFKEKTEKRLSTKKDLTNFTKEEFIERLQEAGIVGLGGDGFPTYVKYNTNKKIHTLIINAVECEPYITADYAVLKEHVEEILEAIDAVMEINHIDETLIAVKKENTVLIDLLNNFAGTYLKIKIAPVPNGYPMGWEKKLVYYLKHVSYQKTSVERGIVVSNVSTMYAIYEALKYHAPLTERVITLTGEMLKEPQNIQVKIGAKLSEIIESIGGYKKPKDIYFVAGGPMMGHTMPDEDLVVSANLSCVLVLPKLDCEKETACIHCGKCVESCPAKLSPVLIMQAKNQPKKLCGLEPGRCIECGLCSYICPAKISVRESVIAAKQTLNQEGDVE